MIAEENNEMFQLYLDYIMEEDDLYSQNSVSDIIAAHLKMLLLLSFEKYYPKHEDPRRQNICVTNLKCKLLCVRFYILIFVFFLDLYVEMVTVRFHSLPHYEMNDRSQLQLSVYLSGPYSFEALNPNSDAISLSQL